MLALIAVIVRLLPENSPPSSVSPSSDGHTGARYDSSEGAGDEDASDPDEPPTTVPSSAEPATVSDHVDGDTLRVLPSKNSRWFPTDQEATVRLLEIDTPESVAPG